MLTRYFYEALIRFEKDPAGLRTSYVDLLSSIDVRKEQKRAEAIHFASTADPELLHFSRPVGSGLLMQAEQKLSAGEADEARKLAQQALDEKTDDPGRACSSWQKSPPLTATCRVRAIISYTPWIRPTSPK